jgi:hypothetical protein
VAGHKATGEGLCKFMPSLPAKTEIDNNGSYPDNAIAQPGTALECIHIDVIGEIVPSSSKNEKYILCVIDVYS